MSLRILLMAARRERAMLLEQALARARHRVAAWIRPGDDFCLYARQAYPDAFIAELDSPDPGFLGRIHRLCEERPLPVVVFADRSDAVVVRAAIRAGVTAYVVDGFAQQRVLPVLEAAVARFREFQALRRERDEAVMKLAERKLIERAKGILMRRRNLPEEAAYAALRKMAMDRGRRLAEVAGSIVTAEDLLAEG